MTIKHNFYLFFGVSYFVFLAFGLSVGSVLGHFTGLNAGYIVNLICFCAAVWLSMYPFGGRYLYIEGPSSIGVRAIIQKRKISMPIAYGVIGVSIDTIYFFAFSFFFTGEFQDLNILRSMVMVVAYSGLSYVVLTSPAADRKNYG